MATKTKQAETNEEKPKCWSYLRYSSIRQQLGDSERRQLELSENWCKANGMELETVSFADKGISGFHGKNKEKALGAFLLAAKKGIIKANDFLLIEQIDRLGRTNPLSQFDVIREIIRYGIKIITVADGQEYSEDILNQQPQQIYMLFGAIQKAHLESLDKSKRIHELWNGRRAKAELGVKTKSRCPSWLLWNADKKEYEVIPERAEAIKFIYTNYLKGFGQVILTRMLNESKHKSFGTVKHWTMSFVQRILDSFEVIGEKQFYVKDDTGNNIPLGQPIKYYPAVISEHDFYAAKERRENSFMSGMISGKKKVVKLNNLFSGIVKCEYCGDSLFFRQSASMNRKGVRVGTNYYLVCKGAWRTGTCKHKISWKYEHLEKSILTYIYKHLDLDALLGNGKRKDEIHSVNITMGSLRNQITSLQGKVANWQEVLGEVNKEKRQGYYQLIDKAESEITELQNQLHKLERQFKGLSVTAQDCDYSLEELRRVISLNLQGRNTIEIRRQLRNMITSIIDRIEVAPSGSLVYGPGNELTEETDGLKYFRIIFRSGTRRRIDFMPTKDGKVAMTHTIDIEADHDAQVKRMLDGGEHFKEEPMVIQDK